MATGTTTPTGPTASPNRPGPFGPGRAQIAATHLRVDRWWLSPLLTFLGLLAFIVYATWRAFANGDYFSAPYISPFYSPCLATNCVPMSGSAELHIFGSWWGLSPALLILVFPLGFRLTCYYYRKAYYRAFWLSPPACAVGEPHQAYSGETRFPLLGQNVHRYFFYFGLIFNVILSWDAILGFRNASGQWGHMGLGTLVLLANATLLWIYSLSCHSCRHIIGGRLKHFSRHPLRYRFWSVVSRLNTRHMLYAWISLAGVALTDLYVMLVASGTFADPRFF
jgi:hypothetical protein